MNTTLKRLVNLILCLMLVVLCMTSCANQAKEDDPNRVQVYYLKSDENGMVCEDYHVLSDMTNTKAVIEELLAKMRTMPEKLEYEAPIYGPVNLLSYKINGDVLTLNFSSTYTTTEKTTEILDRAAMVRTLTQVPGIQYVTFTVENTPLLDSNGNIIGNMSADNFVYNAGNEINTYEKVELILYFATDDGEELIPVYRSVVYNSNILMQRLAIEQLLKGPNTDLALPTLNPQTKINSVSVRDGVCYVDFDEGILTQVGNISPKAALYSLVNTICETADVNKVQISVNGQTSATFMENVSLDTIFERNLDIVRE
ncbi:GerMN domain-containing protein [Butyrivibrio sp. INlla16]|uniref:GerMN domain-containing protein n=1 Tax=Butyrivibrio sp. INlla16 TaxID=1520807 RepID=UPI000880C02A|nr:GerMN domain-containing protein [Butyrivibrio sp. INlla16]SDB62391.1 germination protein M [Butyrivibrio sp. INlla16]